MSVPAVGVGSARAPAYALARWGWLCLPEVLCEVGASQVNQRWVLGMTAVFRVEVGDGGSKPRGCPSPAGPGGVVWDTRAEVARIVSIRWDGTGLGEAR